VIIASTVSISKDVLNVSYAVISDEKNIISTINHIQKKSTQKSKIKYYKKEVE